MRPSICLDAYNKFVLLIKFLYSDRDDLPEYLDTTTAHERQKVHFRLMCVAQKRLCLSSLICLKGVVSYTQATVPQLHHLACRFFLPLLCFFSSLFAFSSFLPVGFFIPASPSCVMHQSIPPAPCLPPTPRATVGPLPALSVPRGGAFANFTLSGGRAFTNLRAIPELLTRTRFPIRI